MEKGGGLTGEQQVTVALLKASTGAGSVSRWEVKLKVGYHVLERHLQQLMEALL